MVFIGVWVTLASKAAHFCASCRWRQLKPLFASTTSGVISSYTWLRGAIVRSQRLPWPGNSPSVCLWMWRKQQKGQEVKESVRTRDSSLTAYGVQSITATLIERPAP